LFALVLVKNAGGATGPEQVLRPVVLGQGGRGAEDLPQGARFFLPSALSREYIYIYIYIYR